MLMAVLKFTLVVLVVLAIPALVQLVRRIWLVRVVASFDCRAMLDTATPGSRWVSGVARFRGEELWWYPYIGWTFHPKLRFPRQRTIALPTHEMQEASPGPECADYRVVPLSRQIGGGTAVWELAMAPAAVTALLSWLEAAPPGMGTRRRPEIQREP